MQEGVYFRGSRGNLGGNDEEVQCPEYDVWLYYCMHLLKLTEPGHERVLFPFNSM